MYSNHSNHDNQIEESRSPPDSQRTPPSEHLESPPVRSRASPEARASPEVRGSPASRGDPHQNLFSQMTFGAKKVPEDAIALEQRAQLLEHTHDYARANQAEQLGQGVALKDQVYAAGGESMVKSTTRPPAEDISKHQILLQNQQLQRESGCNLALNDVPYQGAPNASTSHEAAVKDTHAEAKQGSQAPLASQLSEQKSEKQSECSMEIDATAQQNEPILREFAKQNEPSEWQTNSYQKHEASASVRKEQQPKAMTSQSNVEMQNQNNVTDSCDKNKPNLQEDQNAQSCLSDRQGELMMQSELERPDQYTPRNPHENEGNQVFQNGEITSKKQISDQPIENRSNTNSPFKDENGLQYGSPQPKQTPQYSQMKTRFNGSKNVQVQDDQTSMRRKNARGDSGQNSNSKQKAPSQEKNSSFKNYLKDSTTPVNGEGNRTAGHMLSIYNQNRPHDGIQKSKKQAPNQFEECLKTYGKMFQFDWDLKEFTNARHSPKEDLTPGAFWFFINTTFFRYDLLELLKENSFEEWTRPIIEAQNRFALFGTLNSCSQVQQQLGQNEQPSETIVKYLPNGKVRIHSSNFIQSQYARERKTLDQQNDPCMSDDDDQWNFIDCKSTQDMLDICKNDEKNEQLLFHVSKLIRGKRKKFQRFKKHFCHLEQRVGQYKFDDEQMIDINAKAKEIPRNPIVAPFLSHRDHEASFDPKSQSYVINYEQPQVNDQDPDQEIAERNKSIDLQNFQKMMNIAEKDLQELHEKNQTSLQELYDRISSKYKQALETSPNSPSFRDRAVYKPQNISEYGQDFLSYVDPHYVQDIMKNSEWYNQNMDRFLLNLNYPCKLQNDFLKELERAQQRRNDMKYRKILDQMDRMESMRNDQDMDSQTKRMKLEQEIKQINQKQRALIAQDGACCAICGVGDYEDDDQIVFCARCSIPVHQSCFGLENIPDIDWICYNCFTFGFQRGLMVKCFLCPKRGGAMKPTNIFRSYDKFYDQKIKILTKKTGKSQIEKLVNQAQQHSQLHNISEEQLEAQQSQGKDDAQPFNIYKQQVMIRLENNCCLNEVLLRECNYHEKMYVELYEEEEKQKKKDQNDSTVTNKEPVDEKRLKKLQAYAKIMEDQDKFELNFNDHERSNHSIPEDYSHFIQRNESKLEMPDTPITDSLYHWVHHSCSMWTQGPQITPKTPVKMNKLDFQKFSIGCIICGKKGVNVGSAVKCFKQDCNIYFHVECAKRANYCMEVDKKGGKNNRDKTFKIYCESHRPFKIIQEINDLNQKEIEEIQKFAKTIEKCYDSYQRYQQKPKKLISKTERNKLLRFRLQTRKQELVQQKKEMKLLNKPKKEKKGKKEKQKKWKEKDKKTLLERVKDKYLAIKKLRFNLIKVNPMIAETKRYEKELKRIQKLKEKKRKKQLEIQKDIYLKKLLGERDVKNQGRGLRQRNKLNENEEDLGMRDQSLADGLNTTIDPNMQDHQTSMVNEETLRNYHEANTDQMATIPDAQMQMDQLSDKGADQDLKLSLENEDELFQLPTLQEIPEYYKYANPMNIQELEWTVTLSRFDFPWHEIEFEPFSAKECYRMYTSLVSDAQSFLKRVLGDKVKYQKMIQNQLKGLPTIDLLLNMQNPNAQNPIVLAPLFESSEKQSKDPKNDLALAKKDSLMTLGDQQVDAKDQPNVAAGNFVNLGYFTIYCVCKGQVQQEFMVACETGEDLCPNKGWLHPQCTDDLKDLSKEEIDNMEIWYCMDCRKKNNSSIHLSNSKEKKTRAIQESPLKSSQKRGGSICIETDSIEKRENLSNDSLKKQLIIRFTEEELDEQPRNRQNEVHQEVHSDHSTSEKQSMELQAHEQFVDPRTVYPHQKKYQQQQFQINQMKQVKLQGFRVDDAGSKPQSKSKQSAFSKSGENTTSKRANQTYLNQQQQLNFMKSSSNPAQGSSKPNNSSKRKTNQSSNIFTIHSDYGNAPSLAKKQRHDQPVPGMKKNAQLFQSSKSKHQQQQQQQQMHHQKISEAANHDRNGQVIDNSNNNNPSGNNNNADAAFLEQYKQDILDIVFKSEQQNNEQHQQIQQKNQQQQQQQQQSIYHSQSYQNSKSANQGPKHSNVDQMEQQYSQSNNNRQRGNSSNNQQSSHQDDQFLLQQIHQLFQMPQQSNSPEQPPQKGSNNSMQQQQQHQHQQQQQISENLTGQQDLDKLIQELLLQYQDQSNDDQNSNQQLLKLILENQFDQNENKPQEIDLRKQHQQQSQSQKLMVQSQEQKERNYDMLEYRHQQSQNHQQQQQQQQQQPDLMELLQMQNQSTQQQQQHQEKQHKKQLQQQQQQQSEQAHTNQMNVEEPSQNDILRLISLLAAESPPQNSKNQQQYDPSELPEELKHLHDKQMGLEPMLESIQKQKIAKQQQRQMYQKQQQQQQQQQYDDHQRSKNYHSSQHQQSHQQQQQQQHQQQQQQQQTQQMEQILNNLLMAHMEQQQQQQQQNNNTSSVYQGSGSKPQNSQQSHHQQHSSSNMHMQDSTKIHNMNSSSTTREMATPEQMQIIKLLANQSQMEASKQSQSTPQQKNNPQQQDEDESDCMAAKSNNHNYQQLLRQNHQYQREHSNQQQQQQQQMQQQQFSSHDFAAYEQQMNNQYAYYKKQMAGGQAHQQSQGYSHVDKQKSLQHQHIQQQYNNFVLNGGGQSSQAAAQASSAATAHHHHPRKVSHSSSGYTNSAQQQYGQQSASQHQHISQQQASNQYESQMHHQQQMQAAAHQQQQQQQLHSQILQQVQKDDLEMYEYELSDDQLQMILSQISQNKL